MYVKKISVYVKTKSQLQKKCQKLTDMKQDIV